MTAQRIPGNDELMFALGQMHSDVKATSQGIADLRNSVDVRLNEHSKRMGRVEKTQTRIVAYAAGLSAGVFLIGTALKDKFPALFL